VKIKDFSVLSSQFSVLSSQFSVLSSHKSKADLGQVVNIFGANQTVDTVGSDLTETGNCSSATLGRPQKGALLHGGKNAPNFGEPH
jgi:hypothetical protein